MKRLFTFCTATALLCSLGLLGCAPAEKQSPAVQPVKKVKPTTPEKKNTTTPSTTTPSETSPSETTPSATGVSPSETTPKSTTSPTTPSTPKSTTTPDSTPTPEVPTGQ